MKSNNLMDGQIFYIPNKGIYRWDESTGVPDVLFGKPLNPFETEALFPAMITDSVLEALGFQECNGDYVLGDLTVKRNLIEPYFMVNDNPITYLTELEKLLSDHGRSIVYDNSLLSSF